MTRFNEDKVRVRNAGSDGVHVTIGSSRYSVPDDAYRAPDQSVGFNYGGWDGMRPEGWAGIIHVHGPSRDMHLTAPQCRELADYLTEAAYQQEQWEARQEREAAEARKRDGILVSRAQAGLTYEVKGYDPQTFNADDYRVLTYSDSIRREQGEWMGSGSFGNHFTFVAGARVPE